ncbi:aminotransferase class V-fold PLP-dependent enzyme [Actinokineospora pegani]|uniref:aminotransferase class V-fold PLP-dependent enzyme n=1 Tax=Actinokineospora pegani TaxID=2654637 RepID=UPI0012EA9A2B|nr:aminotransferase class V-fold PLP-dependent enzyme [Actinokineospora pegani]
MRAAFGEDFDVPPGYLNTASVGIPPARVADTVDTAVRRWRTGAATPPEFDAPVEVARAAWARLVGVDVGSVAIGAAVAHLVSQVAAGVPDGTRVLTARNEFTSLTFPFAARGLEVVEVDLDDLVDRAPDFDLVAVSVVQSADGRVVDLDGLHATGAMVLLDATQAAGWLPLRLDWADWVVCAGYKWLLCPRGAAWLAVHPRAVELTRPVAANWYAGEDRWRSLYGLPLRQAADARAFDLSPVWFAQAGAAESLTWLAGLDLAEVRAHCVGLADGLLERMGSAPRGSAIVSIDAPTEPLTAAGIRCSSRAGRARLAFHLYNTVEDVEAVLGAL